MKNKEYLDGSWMDFQDKIYDWNLLNNKERKFVDKFLKDWEELLPNKKLKEEDYHKFLPNYAGFFLDDVYRKIEE